MLNNWNTLHVKLATNFLDFNKDTKACKKKMATNLQILQVEQIFNTLSGSERSKKCKWYLLVDMSTCLTTLMSFHMSMEVFMNLKVFNLVATPLLEECENDTHTPKMGTWESFGTLETSEFDCKGQNTSPWGVLYIIGKLSTCRCRKSEVWIKNYERAKFWESKPG
jgi:hypothetical protein